MTIYDFIDKALEIKENWISIQSREIVFSYQRLIYDLIKDQWIDGENEDSKVVGRYKPVTENYYSKINPPLFPKKTNEPYNLIWSGSLINELFIDYKSDKNSSYILIDSSANSKDGLFSNIKREGLVNGPESIFGLNQKNNENVNQLIEDNLIENFVEFLNLK